MFSYLWMLLLVTGLAQAGDVPARTAPPLPGSLDCEQLDPCSEVLPGAARFEREADKPYAVGFDAEGEPVGWVVISNDVVDIKAYSGKPMSTLVGLSPQGEITGGRVIHHAEPILLVGIPEAALSDFVAQYVGIPADAHVTVGSSDDDEVVSVDGVSGATVTVLAQNQTIVTAARVLAQDVGVIERTRAREGHFVEGAEPLSWAELVSSGSLGHMRVDAEEMGGESGEVPFLDLYFTIADAPHVGIPLLGEQRYKRALADLQEGEHLFVAFNGGQSSFKGSGFVRGGIFDRFRVEQGLRTQTFRDLDYTNIGRPAVDDAPDLIEGGLFISREHNIDPGEPYDLVFLASAYDTTKGAFNRDFRSFSVTHRLPGSVYEVEGWSADALIAWDAWTSRVWRPVVLVIWLLGLVGLFSVGRRWMTGGGLKRLVPLHIGVMAGSVIILGLILRAQPSITQLLTIVGGLVGEWRWSLFFSDPLIFLSWVFIAGILFVWGRGVFCGWACPYGALSELLYKAGKKLGLPELIIPDRYHRWLRYSRYLVLIGLVGAYLYDAQLGEQMAEVEPFKSTWYVAPWTRHPALFSWWIALLVWSVFSYRPFCQYLCPLGAALAVPSYVRISGPRRRDFCSKCKICTRGCEPRAIDNRGVINGADCLNCMECEANYYDDYTCPPLVKKRRDRERGIAGRAKPARAAQTSYVALGQDKGGAAK